MLLEGKFTYIFFYMQIFICFFCKKNVKKHKNTKNYKYKETQTIASLLVIQYYVRCSDIKGTNKRDAMYCVSTIYIILQCIMLYRQNRVRCLLCAYKVF